MILIMKSGYILSFLANSEVFIIHKYDNLVEQNVAYKILSMTN
uniref:Uncharacterized protein n=1 Tax=Anguilla anguilla TaxID=7936 RepID=A0A0E9SUF3_ANGAN